MTAALDTIDSAVRRAFARPPETTVSRWAAENRRIVAEDSAETGAWRNQRTPYLVGIMDAFDDPVVRSIALRKAERQGGSEAVLNILGKIIDRNPGPTLFVYPEEDTAEDVNRSRVLPTILKTPALAQHLTGKPRDLRTMNLKFDRMTIRFRGSNAGSKLEVFGYQYVIVDELDRCDPAVVDKLSGRGVTFPGSKRILISTPEDEWSGDPEDKTQGIDRFFRQGDGRELHVPCPSCGEYHKRTFSRVRWDGGIEAHHEEVGRTAWFLCPNPQCEAKILGHQNAAQLAKCVWVPRGWKCAKGGVVISPEGKEFDGIGECGGAYIPSGMTDVSFALHGLYSPFVPNPYGYLASEFVRNGGQPTRQWVCRKCGEGWSRKGQRIERSELQVLCGYIAPTALGGGGLVPARRVVREWKLGVCPADVELLTAYADVQGDRMYMEVEGWSAHCARGYLVDAVTIARNVSDQLAGLSEWLMKSWPVIDLFTGEDKGVRPLSLVGVDTSFYTDEGYAFVRPRQKGWWHRDAAGKLSGPKVIACKGDSAPKGGMRGQTSHRWSTPEKESPDRKGHSGTRAMAEGGINLLLMNTWYFKRVIFDTLRAELAGVEAAKVAEKAMELGEESRLPDPIRRRWFFPTDTPKWYFDQLTAEEEVDRMVGGRVVKEWKIRPGRHSAGNHMLDCRVGNLCLADAAKLAQMLVPKAPAKPSGR